MDQISIDTACQLVAQHFAAELAKFRAKSGRSSNQWSTDHLTLYVDVSDKVEFRIEYSGNTHVRAAKLGPLMDEVYRRAGFDDRQAGQLQAESDALMALPRPGPNDKTGTITDHRFDGGSFGGGDQGSCALCGRDATEHTP